MDKVVPSTAEAVVDVDARAEDIPDRECRDPGACVRSEPATWSLRTRDRHDSSSAAGCRIRRTRPGDLTGQRDQPGSRTTVDQSKQPCARDRHVLLRRLSVVSVRIPASMSAVKR